ncbi:MAG: DUF4097 family beta strand repeat-containing protein, partial [Bacteroidia bacterium]|nr:DUF4097 family beta strand repeat-containing protein [Bacteroidia bacterium]
APLARSTPTLWAYAQRNAHKDTPKKINPASNLFLYILLLIIDLAEKTMRKSIILLCLYVVSLKSILSQTTTPNKVQVVTKLVQKSIPIQNNQNLQFETKRAKLLLSPSTDNQIHIKISLIAKHTSKQKAEKDLQALTYQIIENQGTITLKNDIQRDKVNERVTSLLKTIYEVQVPSSVTVGIKQKYGEIEIEKINSNLNIDCNYTDIKLAQLHAEKVDIQTNYSDIVAKNCSGKFTLIGSYNKVKIYQAHKMHLTGTFNYSEILIEDFSGEANINANYSEIEMSDIKETQRMNIISNYSDIEFKDVQNLAHFGFDIAGNFSDIDIAEPLKKDFVRTMNRIVKNAAQGSPVIKITANYGDIEIE